MVFSSLEFLFIFLPLFLVVYYILPKELKNLWVLIGSLGFYIWGSIDTPQYILLFFSSIILNYGFGLAIKFSPKKKMLCLTLGLIYNLGWLIIFKYSDFIFTNIKNVFATVDKADAFRLPIMNLILPLGISFYTFQIVSYLVDVYKGKIDAEMSIINFAAYISMFPKLISGPITKYSDIKENFHSKALNLDVFNDGLKTFTIGLGLKVILANQIGNLWSDISTIGYESISTPLAWMGVIAFSLQLYFDFYGYSLMAVGLGKLIGFKIPQNFNYPYLTTSMTEFWRKWHITLGSWFREYVYIPLGGNRSGKTRTILNLMIVWILTGLWHGASWNFVLWGFILLIIISIEKLGLKRFLDKYRIFGHLYMMLLIPTTWLVFAISDFPKLIIYFGRLFPFLNTPSTNIFEQDYIKYSDTYGLLLIIGLIFSTNIPHKIYNKIKDSIIATILLLIIFWLSVYLIYIVINDPFLYFRF